MDMIAFPVKFDSTGLKKLTDGTNDYYSQLLTICLLTEPLTHPFTPSFGVNDPTFGNIDKGLFVLNASRFIPEVSINGLSITGNDSNTGKTKISFSFTS
jgi:hypothetical protein